MPDDENPEWQKRVFAELACAACGGSGKVGEPAAACAACGGSGLVPVPRERPAG